MPWGFIVGGAASLLGSVIGGNAAESAAQTQANAAQAASQTELQMFNQTQANLSPWLGAGKNALGALDYGLGIGPNTGGVGAAGAGGYGSLMAPFSASMYQQSPGYAWQMGQGISAVQNSASAGGGIKGGNTLAALTTFGQGLANSDYQQAYQNYIQQQQQRYAQLSGVSGQGANAAANLGGFSANVGAQIGSNAIGAGNALAAGTIGQANAYGGGLNSLAQLSNLYGSGSMGGGVFGQPNYGSGSVASPGGIPPYQAGTPYGSGANTGVYCDYALKDDIEPYLFDGQSRLLVYSFRFKDEAADAPKRLGYLAQEVEKRYPEAVSRGQKGYLKVDYSKVPSEQDWSALDALGNVYG
jgi:hypothetical protein